MSFAVTTDFTANTVISSTSMNTNFADIETAINSVHSYIGAGVITNAMLAGSIDLTTKVTGVLPLANGGTEFDTGDICLSTAAKDESGWTEITSTYAGRYLRAGATGLATGGNSSHTHGAVTGSHTLTTAEMPAHTHTFTRKLRGGYPANNEFQTCSDDGGTTSDKTTASNGDGGGHTHTITAADNDPIFVDLRLFQKS